MAIDTGRSQSPTPSSERTPLLSERGGDAERISDPIGPINNKFPETFIPTWRRVLIVILSAVLVFIQTTNVSLITTTQSAIAADLDAFSETTWFSAAFMISGSSLTPLSGRLSKIFGPANFLVFSSIVMAIGLLVTASAPTVAVFITGRAITGCGCGGVMSTVLILVLALSSKERRGLFMGVISVMFTTGIAMGAIIGGAMTPRFGWRSIYYIEAPTSIIAGTALYFSIPPTSNSSYERTNGSKGSTTLDKLKQIDWLGAILLISANVSILYSMASAKISVVLIGLGFIIFGFFLIVEAKYATEPIIPTSLLASRGLLCTCIATLGLMMARWEILFYSPVYTIAVRGWSPMNAGFILIPTNAGFGLGGLIVGWLHIRKADSYWASCVLLYFLSSCSMFLLAIVADAVSHIALYVAVIFINGFFAGALLNYTMCHALFLTQPETHYIVAALVAMFRGFAGSFASAIGGGIFTRVLQTRLSAHHDLDPDLIRKLVGSPAMVGELHGFEKMIAIDAYESATKTLVLSGCVLTLIMTVVQAGTGWTGPPTKPYDAESTEEEIDERGSDGDDDRDTI